jgi:hypothetical protein
MLASTGCAVILGFETDARTLSGRPSAARNTDTTKTLTTSSPETVHLQFIIAPSS